MGDYGGAPEERNAEATLFVGELAPEVTDALLWELFVQAGPLRSVYVPRDKIQGRHHGYGFVEYQHVRDAEYAVRVMQGVRLYGQQLRVSLSNVARPQPGSISAGYMAAGAAGSVAAGPGSSTAAGAPRNPLDVGAVVFVGGLDETVVDAGVLARTFAAFGPLIEPPRISHGSGATAAYAFLNFDSFEAADAAIEAMDGQYLGTRPITVSYAYRRDAKGERHGSEAERTMAAKKRAARVAAAAAAPPPPLPPFPVPVPALVPGMSVLAPPVQMQQMQTPTPGAPPRPF